MKSSATEHSQSKFLHEPSQPVSTCHCIIETTTCVKLVLCETQAWLLASKAKDCGLKRLRLLWNVWPQLFRPLRLRLEHIGHSPEITELILSTIVNSSSSIAFPGVGAQSSPNRLFNTNPSLVVPGLDDLSPCHMPVQEPSPSSPIVAVDPKLLKTGC